MVCYLVILLVTYKIGLMLTSIEIAKILYDQKKKEKKAKSGFDSALLGLGVGLKMKRDKK